MIKLRNARHNYILTDKCSQLKGKIKGISLRCEHINVFHTHILTPTSTIDCDKFDDDDDEGKIAFRR